MSTATTKEVSSPYAMFTSSELESLKGKINIDESSLIGIFPYVPFEIALDNQFIEYGACKES